MKSLTLFLTLLLGCVAAAQQFPRYELSAGYSYGSPDNLSTSNRYSPQGWNGSLATNWKRWIGVEVDAGGQYLNKSVLLAGVPYSLNSGFYAFHAGPRFAYRGERLRPFAHTLFGVHRTLSYSQATFPVPGQVVIPFENAFGTAAGGGIDFAVTRRVALRTQGDYFFTRLNSLSTGYENRFRIVGGIVFTFGGVDSWSAKRSRPPLPPVDSVSTSSVRAQEPPVQSLTTVPVAAPQPAPAYATVAPAPRQITPISQSAARTQPLSAYAPVPSKPAAPPTSARVVGATRDLNSQISNRPATSTQEESLGDVARRYRAQKKKQQEQTH